jgi:hypothetical protein
MKKYVDSLNKKIIIKNKPMKWKVVKNTKDGWREWYVEASCYDVAVKKVLDEFEIKVSQYPVEEEK